MSNETTHRVISSRSWYSAPVAELLESSNEMVLGMLTAKSGFAVLPTQTDAWLAQIQLLKQSLQGLKGWIFFEFSIPRMGRRIDVVLLIDSIVFAIEFKVGDSDFGQAAIEQVWDYALDLKNFHEASHNAQIVPILIATSDNQVPDVRLIIDCDQVFRPIRIRPSDLRSTIEQIIDFRTGNELDANAWASAPYRPSPTIIEAARALYAQHSVEEIARYDAGAQNLRVTSSRIEELIDEARRYCRKLICFVTGVPGAGKTLVGLNVATHKRDVHEPTHAVFLSGNTPLVDVLREALTRDEVTRQRRLGVKVRKGKVGESVKAFIQNVHHFRDDLLIDTGPPAEHVAIFDEAQRAWNLKKTSDFMQRKKGVAGFAESEPEFLLSCMDRHQDWAVVVCLVGGGQEIHTGEAGICSWIEAAGKRFNDWHIYLSSRLTDSEYQSSQIQALIRDRRHVKFDDMLHLSVSMRSFRAEAVSEFVRAMLDRDSQCAIDEFLKIRDRFPVVITRSLPSAKKWLRGKARGSERYGVVASSKAHRLKPDAIDIRVNVDPIHWFLNDRSDTRSSYYLEDAATEFQVQGLELDWTCVAWDGDLRFDENGWRHHYFRGDRWCNISNKDNQRYLLNAYRVLLTRARQGMVIYVPSGDPEDATRLPEFYDATYRYLQEFGLPAIDC